jgi:N-acyl-D-aspartate/D-glutamate deacylase
MHDILIRGGTLFDGSGSPGVPGEILITDGRIAGIGQNLEGRARKTIDAQGLAVAPGFIDIKTHSDFTLPINPEADDAARWVAPAFRIARRNARERAYLRLKAG